MNLKGTGVALITPFNRDGSIDHSSLEKLVNHCIEGGVNFLVLMGTTGESVTLSKKEKQEAIQTIKNTNQGRLPMVLGIGGNNTAAVIEEYQSTDLSDYAAVLTASPAYNKPTQQGIYEHYKAIATNTESNIILYNVPGRTASNINSETTLKLANDFENIIAIKEASPNYLQSSEILKDKPSDFIVFSGDDEFALPMTLAGGQGVISVIGQALPSYSQMIEKALLSEVDDAYKIHYHLMDIIRSIYVEGNPAGIKALLSIMGICKPYTRLPLVPASEKLTQDLKTLYHNL